LQSVAQLLQMAARLVLLRVYKPRARQHLSTRIFPPLVSKPLSHHRISTGSKTSPSRSTSTHLKAIQRTKHQDLATTATSEMNLSFLCRSPLCGEATPLEWLIENPFRSCRSPGCAINRAQKPAPPIILPSGAVIIHHPFSRAQY